MHCSCKIPSVPEKIVEFDGRILGRGSFSTVFLVRVLGEELALKYFKKTSNNFQSSRKEKEEEHARNDVKCLISLKHKNIIQLVGIVREECKSVLGILLEYMIHGCLHTYLKTTCELRLQPSQEKKRLSWCHDVIKALQYLHDQGILHRDIAARNIFLDSKANAKIGDFGNAYKFRENEQELYYKDLELSRVPVRWTPKEGLSTAYSYNSKRPSSSLENNIKCSGMSSSFTDIWAYGVLMWEIFTDGSIPYAHLPTKDTVARAICSDKDPATKYFALKPFPKIEKLLRCILHEDYKKRPTATQVRLDLELLLQGIESQCDKLEKHNAKETTLPCLSCLGADRLSRT